MRTRGRPRHPDILTPREWEVHGLIQEGASNEDIARRLNITERTAKYHVSEILSKLGVSSREEAVLAVAERGARPVGPARLFGHWALFARVAIGAAAVVTLAGVGILAWGVLNGGDESNRSDMSLSDAYGDIVQGATQDGKLLHTTTTTTYPGAPDPSPSQTNEEYWIDARADVVREKLHTPEEALGQQMGNTEHIYSGPYTYYARSTGTLYIPGADGAARHDAGAFCVGTTKVALVQIFLGCESGPYIEQDVPTVKPDATWDGHPAIALSFTVRQLPLESEPTYTPGGTSTGTLVTTYVDPDTFLPIATESKYSVIDTYGIRVVSYQNEFIDRSSVAADFLDPHSIGYGIQDEQVQLSNLNADVPVYWFGDDIAEQDNFPELILKQVLPATPYYPARVLYQTPDAHAEVTIALWKPEDWVSHFAALQEPYFADPDCTTETQIDANGYTAHVFPLPDYYYGVPPAGTCASRLLDTQVFNRQDEVSYFAFVDLGNVVVEFRPDPRDEYDHSDVVRTLLSQLRPFTPNP